MHHAVQNLAEIHEPALEPEARELFQHSPVPDLR